MVNIKIDFSKKIKPMKPMHGLGQPPFSGIDDSMFHYLTEAGIPYSRLHDVGGAYGDNRFVDVPNIFRDFNADVNDPASYDFVFTDWLLAELVKADCEPYYRLGITIENNADMKAYRTAPPQDFQKWAEICEHIVAHYNEGWANGFHYNIRYWEIWNEPDGTVPGFPYRAELWNGTPEQFYELYDVAAKHLKKKFPNIKVGGYAATAFRGIFMTPEEYKGSREELFINFFNGFFDYIKEHNSPIDFFSWHSYNVVDKMVILDNYVHEQLTKRGYGDLETHINEWNPKHGRRGTAFHAAHVLACMLAMQNGYPAVMNLYDGRIGASSYGALFNPMTCKPFPTYYGLVAFNELYKLKEQCETAADTEGIYAISASDGKNKKTLIVNLTEEKQEIEYAGAPKTYRNAWVVDEEHLLGWTPQIKTLEPYQILLIEW